MVNARGEHRVGTEILKELRSADRVDLLCSFLKWSGSRLIREGLEEVAQRGRVRVLTTCYTGTDLPLSLPGTSDLCVSSGREAHGHHLASQTYDTCRVPPGLVHSLLKVAPLNSGLSASCEMEFC
jgi:hypothetical protein